MGALLDAVLQDTSSDLEWIVELYSAKRSDGTLKTWTFSSIGRDLGSGVSAYPFLLPGSGAQIGPLSQSLSEDLLFGGLAESAAGSIRLVQVNPDIIGDTDILSSMLDYTFAGYKCRVRVCLQSLAQGTALTTTNCPYFRTAYIDQEPTWAPTDRGPSLSFPLMSALQRMAAEPLIVSRYVGIPHCLKSITASASRCPAPHNAVYNITSFTVMARARISAPTALFQTITNKFSAGDGSDIQFSIQLYNTTGYARVSAAFGGVLSAPYLLSEVNYADGAWHTYVFSIKDKTTAYFMIDGDVVDSDTPASSVATNSGAINMWSNMIGRGQDVRFYSGYMTPDEARVVSSVRADGDDLRVLGMWRFDDNTGSVANDYSATGNDTSAFGGTVNVDWKWDASDLGEPEQAGNVQQMIYGSPFNVLMRKIDTARERYRAHVEALTQTVAIKSRGTSLVLTTDYTDEGGGIYKTVAAEDEPLTMDLSRTSNITDAPSQLAWQIATERSRLLDSTDIEDGQRQALHVIGPWASGFYLDSDATIGSVLSDLLGGSGMHFRENVDGQLWMDMLVLPYGKGPYGDSWLDMMGRPGTAAQFSGGGTTGNFTCAAWFITAVSDADTRDNGSVQVLVDGGTSNYKLSLRRDGANAGKLAFTIGPAISSDTVYSSFIVQPHTRYFGAAVLDSSADTCKLFLAADGDSLVEVGSISTTNVPSSGATFDCGSQLWGAMSHIHLWSVTKSLADLQALMTTPPVGNEANLLKYVPMTDGSGDTALEVVSQTTGTIGGTRRWAPRTTINLEESPEIELSEAKLLKPAWKVTVYYKKNWNVVESSEIDSGVSASVKVGLKREWLNVTLEDVSIRDGYIGAREIVLYSYLNDREDAMRLARVLKQRFSSDTWICRLSWSEMLVTARASAGMDIGDELFLISSCPSILSSGRSMRIVAKSFSMDGTCSIAAVG